MTYISDQNITKNRKTRKPFFPAWYLRNDRINATESQLEDASSSCEWWAIGFGVLVIVSVVVEFIISLVGPQYTTFLLDSAFTDAGIAIGVVGEVAFGMWDNRIQTELRKRSNDKLSVAIEVAAAANERAAKADLERAALENRLRPRDLIQAQWDWIQGLSGKFSVVNIACTTNAETLWFASQLRDAFVSAGITVNMICRGASPHRFGTQIFEPKGFDNAHPRTVWPLVEIFRRSGSNEPCEIIRELHGDIIAAIGSAEPKLTGTPFDDPMIIVDERFLVPPLYWPRFQAITLESNINPRESSM